MKRRAQALRSTSRKRAAVRSYLSRATDDAGKKSLPLLVPVRTVSEANAHEHWRRRQDRAAQQRSITAAALLFVTERPQLPCTIRLTRIGRGLMDSDNAVGALKHVRDTVATWLGVDDGPTGPVTWEYGPQERGEYAVRIEVREQAEGA